MSRDYAYQFLQGDLDLVRYHDPPISATEQQLRLLNGTLNKYLIGLAWHLGGFTVDQINDQWDWGGDWNYNQSNNHAPSDALLQVSRIPSALLLAAGVIVMFALGRAARWASGRLSGQPVLRAQSGAADRWAARDDGRQPDVFSLLTVLAGVWLLQKRRWWTAILLGNRGGAGAGEQAYRRVYGRGGFWACAVVVTAGRADCRGAAVPLLTACKLAAAPTQVCDC